MEKPAHELGASRLNRLVSVFPGMHCDLPLRQYACDLILRFDVLDGYGLV